MKNNNFGKLKRKIFLQVVGIAALATVIGCSIMWFFVDGLLQAPFADWFVAFCERVLRLDYYGAQTAYRALFQVNKPVWLAVGFIILLLIFFYFGLTRFTRYFQEIANGVDKLTQDAVEEITLSPEMDFMENKLNHLKNTLDKRAKDALEAEQRKNDLVVYLAHDIKTPLTSVIG